MVGAQRPFGPSLQALVTLACCRRRTHARSVPRVVLCGCRGRTNQGHSTVAYMQQSIPPPYHASAHSSEQGTSALKPAPCNAGPTRNVAWWTSALSSTPWSDSPQAPRQLPAPKQACSARATLRVPLVMTCGGTSSRWSVYCCRFHTPRGVVHFHPGYLHPVPCTNIDGFTRRRRRPWPGSKGLLAQA